MSIRNVVVGPPGGSMSMGMGGFGPGPEKKFTSAECKQALMDAINDDPSLVRNHVSLVTQQQRDEMNDKFWPAIFEEDNWTRVSTHRPSKKDDDGGCFGGTDMEVREYENDFWAEDSRILVGKVTTEFGEITDISVEVRW